MVPSFMGKGGKGTRVCAQDWRSRTRGRRHALSGGRGGKGGLLLSGKKKRALHFRERDTNFSKRELSARNRKGSIPVRGRGAKFPKGESPWERKNSILGKLPMGEGRSNKSFH